MRLQWLAWHLLGSLTRRRLPCVEFQKATLVLLNNIQTINNQSTSFETNVCETNQILQCLSLWSQVKFTLARIIIKNVKLYFQNVDEAEWKEERPDFSSDVTTHFIFNPHRSQSIENQRKRLPIFQNRDQVLYLLESYQFLILVGETGSGKSTQVPQVLSLDTLLLFIFVSYL